MPGEYVPGKCNIGRRGRATRLSIGLVILGLSTAAVFFLFRAATPSVVRLVLIIPFYVGLMSILEGTLSFCVFHAAKGTFDLYEKVGPIGKSETKVQIESDEWKKADRRKARNMHTEAALGAIVLTLTVFFA